MKKTILLSLLLTSTATFAADCLKDDREISNFCLGDEMILVTKQTPNTFETMKASVTRFDRKTYDDGDFWYTAIMGTHEGQEVEITKYIGNYRTKGCADLESMCVGATVSDQGKTGTIIGVSESTAIARFTDGHEDQISMAAKIIKKSPTDDFTKLFYGPEFKDQGNDSDMDKKLVAKAKLHGIKSCEKKAKGLSECKFIQVLLLGERVEVKCPLLHISISSSRCYEDRISAKAVFDLKP